KVKLLGYLSEADKRALLSRTELFVMPSPAELQSIATLEAMAAGCAGAAVGYDSSAVPRLVLEAGAGTVLTVADSAAQAAQIVALMADDDALATAQANARASAGTHAVDAGAAHLEPLYLDLLGRAAVG